MNIGIFTKNAIIKNVIMENLSKLIFDRVKEGLFIQKIILISRGREAITV